MEKTLLLVKPDALHRKLLGQIISKVEQKGYNLIAGKLLLLNEDLVRSLYAHHTDKPFFNRLVDYMTSGPVFALLVKGKNVIAEMRRLCGATNPSEAQIGTIRGDMAISVEHNLVHCSDSSSAAETEIPLFFSTNDISSA